MIGQASGITLNVMWSDAAHTTGLDPGVSASIQALNEPVQSIIERLLDSTDSGEYDKATWQLSRNGSIQIGPRSQLNAYKRLQVYDVSDLLKVVPDHRRGPTIDLQQAISGNGVPLTGTDEGNDWLAESRETKDRAEDLAALIRDLVETEQWTENGGEGGTIKLHQNTLIINAADYIHRALTSRVR